MGIHPFSLENKLVLVTGASSGIGRQCAISCSQMGAVVVLLGRDSRRLKETILSMESSAQHIYYSVDLLDYSQVNGIVGEIQKEKGKISGLINCAGISTTLPLKSISPGKIDHFFQTNVTGAINLTNQVVKASNFSSDGGSIVFISSVMGSAGENGKSLYSLTKGALIAAARSLAIEFARRRIRFNCVSPAVVESPMSKNAVYSKDEESLRRIIELHPLGLGQTDDVANACVFLLSEAAKWITGTNLVVDGGYLAL